VPPYAERWLRRYRLRRVGSTALQLCYVAAGALAFVHDHRASLWDVAAAAVIVAEAGGLMTTPDGASLFPIDPHTYAGESIGFLAGDPIGHRSSLADITAGSA
jgi:myo-inositol-1(or 4)-monophosphatase